jgi:hemoglobin
MNDLATRADIERLVDTFYDRVRADDRLGPIFEDVAHVDWSTHLPRMYDFWESVLFGASAFKGNPLAVHLTLAQKTVLTGVEFSRWVELFHQTVDALFTGFMATEAKQRAVRIATIMQYHVAAHQDAGLVLR